MNKAPPDLRRIFYISRAAHALTDAEIQNILRISQRNNRRNDITGCLLCSGEYFAQTLEGRREALDSTLARIAADPRHAEVHVVFDENVDSRICPEWSMGLVYSLDLADRLAALAAPRELAVDDALDLMSRMRADSMMGPL